MNSKLIFVGIVCFLLGAAFNSTHLFPFHWSIPFFSDWDQLLSVGLVIGLFVLYSKVNDIEKRMNRFDHH